MHDGDVWVKGTVYIHICIIYVCVLHTKEVDYHQVFNWILVGGGRLGPWRGGMQ